MLSYCLKFRKNTENKNPNVVKIKTRRVILLSKCAVCDSKKSQLIKEQELLSIYTKINSSRIKTPLSEIPLVGPPLF